MVVVRAVRDSVRTGALAGISRRSRSSAVGQAGADAFVVADEAAAGDAFELVVVDEPGVE